MKIAIVSDLYPPAFIGGYEIGMSWLSDEFRRRGNVVDVFHCREFFVADETGAIRSYRHCKREFQNFDIGPGITGNILDVLRRKIWLWPWFVLQLARSQLTRFRFERKLASEKYDMILMGNPLGLLAPIYQTATRQARISGTRVGLLVSDNWVAAWPSAFVLHGYTRMVAPSPSALRRRGKRAMLTFLRSRVLRRLRSWRMISDGEIENWFLDFAVCVSAYIRSISSPRISAPAKVTVAHWGLPLRNLKLRDELPDFSQGTLKIVFVGQIEAHKGLATLLRAVAACASRSTVTVIGDDTTSHASMCKALVRDLGLAQRVVFAGRMPQSDVYDHLQRSHVMVVPSEWEEPYAIVPLQGKLCGLVTIVSNTGGSSEGIVDEVDGFLFERGNVSQLAELLDTLDADRALCSAVSQRARSGMLEQGDIARMADQILASAGIAPCE
jgi:glycosyltransferase involved in cell wall biosynthesis